MSSLNLRNCAECGKRGWFAKYCCDACKQKAYRKRRAAKRAGGLTGISSMLIDLIGDSSANNAFDELNLIKGSRNQEHAGEAIAIVIYAVQSRMNEILAEVYHE